jgi:hypothetical protein
VEVVPTVATTASGLNSLRRSAEIVSRKAATFIRNSASLGIFRTLCSPSPSAMAALSTELCAWSET